MSKKALHQNEEGYHKCFISRRWIETDVNDNRYRFRQLMPRCHVDISDQMYHGCRNLNII